MSALIQTDERGWCRVTDYAPATGGWFARRVNAIQTSAMTCFLGVNAGTTHSSNGHSWTLSEALPATIAYWANPVVSARQSLMNQAAVSAFLRAHSDISVETLEQVLQWVGEQFADAARSYSIEYDDETQQPMLWLDVETGGMDLREQIRREQELHAKLAKLPNGRALLAKHVISVH